MATEEEIFRYDKPKTVRTFCFSEGGNPTHWAKTVCINVVSMSFQPRQIYLMMWNRRGKLI
jgi:hypothetical protein